MGLARPLLSLRSIKFRALEVRKLIDVTQTIAAIGFPIIITLLVPVRVFILPRLGFSQEELDILDGPVASPFVSATRFDSVETDAVALADYGVCWWITLILYQSETSRRIAYGQISRVKHHVDLFASSRAREAISPESLESLNSF